MAARSTNAAKKPGQAKKAAAPRRRRRAPTHEEIAQRAYLISREGGGDELSHWLRAERELSG